MSELFEENNLMFWSTRFFGSWIGQDGGRNAGEKDNNHKEQKDNVEFHNYNSPFLANQIAKIHENIVTTIPDIITRILMLSKPDITGDKTATPSITCPALSKIFASLLSWPIVKTGFSESNHFIVSNGNIERFNFPDGMENDGHFRCQCKEFWLVVNVASLSTPEWLLAFLPFGVFLPKAVRKIKERFKI